MKLDLPGANFSPTDDTKEAACAETKKTELSQMKL